MKSIAILGGSGHGRVVADAALAAGWQSVVFFDDGWPALSAVGPWTVLGDTATLVARRADYAGAIVAIGDNTARLAKHAELDRHGVVLVTLVHPAATVSPYATVGAGSVVCAGAVVNAFARLGAGCIVNTGASVDHDCELEDGVHVSPGACVGGGVRVGQASWIGIGAAVKHGVAIGSGVTIGAGAAVVDDVADGLTVVGVPARSIRC